MRFAYHHHLFGINSQYGQESVIPVHNPVIINHNYRLHGVTASQACNVVIVTTLEHLIFVNITDWNALLAKPVGVEILTTSLSSFE